MSRAERRALVERADPALPVRQQCQCPGFPRGLSLVGSGIFTAIPFFAASVVNIAANWSGDRLLSAEGVRSGKRRYLVALSLLLTAAGLIIPYVESLAAVVILVSIAASFGNVGPAANGALVGDLLRSPADAGRAFAFLVLGGNSFGLLAPIVTGYLVAATGNFNSAFMLAGLLALIGATVTLVLARGPIGEVSAPTLVQPRLAD
jgi:ACS family glucarate transporter-like MFS transporter